MGLMFLYWNGVLVCVCLSSIFDVISVGYILNIIVISVNT